MVSIYHPIVVDKGTDPAFPVTDVTVDDGSVVGLWFGSNGTNLNLAGQGARDCQTGFGQVSYCNAPNFFRAARYTVSVPPVGTARDGQPCPTVRDFSVVDQDQSDNVATSYRVFPDGRIAQDIPEASAGKRIRNGSDNNLLARFIDPALGCSPFSSVDLNTGTPTVAQALNELSANSQQRSPEALVPLTDPMVLTDGNPDSAKTNLYRIGVDQPRLPRGESPTQYCTNLIKIGAPRIQLDKQFTRAVASPDPNMNLYQFLQDRFKTSLKMLNCSDQESELGY